MTHVALARDPTANRAAKLAYVARHPLKGTGAVVEHLHRNRRTQGTLEQLPEVCGEDPARVHFETVGVEHHLAHIARAYYLSPFESLTAGLSYDASLMAARCEGSRIEVLDRVTLSHSLGFFIPPCATSSALMNSVMNIR